MKKTLMIFSMMLIGVFSASTFAQDADGPILSVEKKVHDYGDITQGSDGKVEFKFTNTGNAPLTISDAKGSCSCTVTDWPKEPIAPGKSGVITVDYDTERIGPINKSVTISSNSADKPVTVVRIRGEVTPK